jgi:hypothetical protein
LGKALNFESKAESTRINLLAKNPPTLPMTIPRLQWFPADSNWRSATFDNYTILQFPWKRTQIMLMTTAKPNCFTLMNECAFDQRALYTAGGVESAMLCRDHKNM